jgi:hypothetical protein
MLPLNEVMASLLLTMTVALDASSAWRHVRTPHEVLTSADLNNKNIFTSMRKTQQRVEQLSEP